MSRNKLTLWHEVEEGFYKGWNIKFVLMFFTTKPHAVEITAHKSGYSVITNLQQISQMIPLDAWPQFALDTFRHRVGKTTQEERLFP